MIWIDFVPHIAKSSRYTIGQRIENKILDLLELSYITYCSEKEKKKDKISECILILDTLKFLISVAWEGKIIPNGKYEELALKLGEAGRMFGGWKKNLDNPQKKNRLA
ncbi:hypothetical protein A2215_01405 [Candidatus Berkelbacteria bacterium RIFOXYA2_FULL_43_10]|uniref:bAvd-like domain-containing protein n=1 Tax=Candidatus Berkelbacteria bacterium RIFOXYA2_FULL_43_10 TaxID=1797472 RepID=A0A1F5E9K3_9BACT|nr:MAG: hypothetical protein A2215_01405 [Candidatus Berkelbacteria bacterium RIFOXYA2_FULL_43_10]